MISVVVPMYNEEAVIDETYRRLTSVLKNLGEDYECIFVDDGSRDKTASLAAKYAEEDSHVRLIRFSRNFGHQIAITAGMEYAKGDAVVLIDADLQDPPEVILQLVEKWKEGYHVVYGQRSRRHGETLFKKFTAKAFYRFLRFMASIDIPLDTGDFRLMDKSVCESLKKCREHNRFMRGMVSWVGYKQCAVSYVRQERFAGETKYPLKKMVRLAMDGISAFSYKPLRLATFLGGILSGVSLLFLFIVLLQAISGRVLFPIWAIFGAVQLFINGCILLALGIIGAYIGRIYEEAKGRPLYIVQEEIGFDKNTK